MIVFDSKDGKAFDATVIVIFIFALLLVVLSLAVEYNHQVEVAKEEIIALNAIISAKDRKIEDIRHKVYTVQRGMAYLKAEVSRLSLVVTEAKTHSKNSGYAIVTAYTPYFESTGKNPGDRGFNITKSGVPGGYGVCAADPRYWEFGTVLYIEGLGVCVILDTGGAIKQTPKGRWRFDYMFGGTRDTAVKLALQWGRKLTRVKVLGSIASKEGNDE